MKSKEYIEKEGLVVSCNTMPEYWKAISQMDAVLEKAYRILDNKQAVDERGLKIEYSLTAPARTIDMLTYAEEDVLSAISKVKANGVPEGCSFTAEDFLKESNFFITQAHKYKNAAKQLEDEIVSKNPIIKIQDAISSGQFKNGDIGEIIFESIRNFAYADLFKNASLFYDGYEFVSIYEDATPKEREILDRMMVSLTGMTMNNIMSEAADRITSRETDKEMDL